MPADLEETILGRVSEMQFAVHELHKRSESMLEAEKFIRGFESRLLSLERMTKNLQGVRDDDIARISTRLDQVHALAAGVRGGRPRNGDREAAEVGQRVMSAMQNPQQLEALIRELQALVTPQSPV